MLSVVFSNDKISLFTPWKLRTIKQSKYGYGAFIVTFYWYLFQLIVLLKPDFSCCNGFALSWVDKVDKVLCQLLRMLLFLHH